MKQKFIIIIFLALFAFVFSANFAFAGSATLSWTANTEPDLAGYKVYYGASSRTGNDPKTCGLCGYSTSVNVGNVTSYTINSLTNGLTYYFSVSAFDTSNNESVFSSQVSKLVSTTADLNANGRINAQDFSILMSFWGSSAKPAADINQDGFVNAQDLSIMMSQWTG